jgi:circadian clock protein KaiC
MDMNKKIQLIKSGISLVDNTWGGFYRGGTYLLLGPRKSGRTLLGLQYAMECAKQKEVCLFFTSMRPKDLMIHAASIDFDLQQYMNQNLIIVVRVAPPTDLYDSANPDDFLIEYLNDIVTVVDQYQPNKIVFDELTPFIGFENLNLLRDVFLRTTESIEDSGITSLFILGDPATPAAKSVVDVLAETVTGIIYLQKNENPDRNQSGKITITPNIGHTEGQFTSDYYIEPYKGITVEVMPPSPRTTAAHTSANITRTTDFRYKPLSDIDLPQDNYSVPNIYNYNDFSLILNNQIALYKSTGQVFSIVSFLLDPAAERQGLFTINQLQNTVRLSSDKKDKICIVNNKVVVLITKDDQKSINSLISKMKSNLPNNDQALLNTLTQFISVFVVKMDDTIQNAEDILSLVMSDQQKEQNKLGFY